MIKSYESTCRICGSEFQSGHKKAQYCPEHRELRRAIAMLRNVIAGKGGKKPAEAVDGAKDRIISLLS